MEILLTGISFRTAPLDLLERVALKDNELRHAFGALAQHSPAPAECVILSTCNRSELYAVFPSATDSREAIVDFICGYFHLTPDEVLPYLYFRRDEEAVRHLLRVSSSVDSLVIGETQIQGQVKHAYFLAREHGQVGPVLSHLFDQALHAGKRVRTETNLGQRPVSVSHLAVDLAREIHSDLSELRFLLIGTGKMGKLAAQYLRSLGASRLLWISRHPKHREYELKDLSGEVASYETLPEALKQSDVVISSSNAPHCVLTPPSMRAAMGEDQRQVTVIDIAMPRDADPAIRQIPGVRLYDLEDLREFACTKLLDQRPDIAAAEAIVAQIAAKVAGQLRAERVTPTIVALRNKAEAIRGQELQKALRRLGPLSEREAEIVAALSVGIVNKLLHEPTTALRTAAKYGDATPLVDLLGQLFNLDEGETSDLDLPSAESLRSVQPRAEAAL